MSVNTSLLDRSFDWLMLHGSASPGVAGSELTRLLARLADGPPAEGRPAFAELRRGRLCAALQKRGSVFPLFIVLFDTDSDTDADWGRNLSFLFACIRVHSR